MIVKGIVVGLMVLWMTNGVASAKSLGGAGQALQVCEEALAECSNKAPREVESNPSPSAPEAPSGLTCQHYSKSHERGYNCDGLVRGVAVHCKAFRTSVNGYQRAVRCAFEMPEEN